MVPNNGSQLPFSRPSLSDEQLAAQIGRALQSELGESRRAIKTVMGWASVSDHTARSWLYGRSSPSGLHLLMLASHSSLVMATVLRLTGHGEIEIGLNLQLIESGLEKALLEVRALQIQHH